MEFVQELFFKVLGYTIIAAAVCYPISILIEFIKDFIKDFRD